MDGGVSVDSPEKRKTAVELYYKYGGSIVDVCRNLGFSSRKALRLWVEEFERTGRMHALTKRFSLPRQMI